MEWGEGEAAAASIHLFFFLLVGHTRHLSRAGSWLFAQGSFLMVLGKTICNAED